jgi:hypothetical protein
MRSTLAWKMKIQIIVAIFSMVAIVTGFAQDTPAKPDLSDSRGLKILRDLEFFDEGYEKHRREALEIVLQHGLDGMQDWDQFFKNRPDIRQIIKKFGEPDMVVFSEEKYFKLSEKFRIIHYFDRIGLITDSKQPNTVVQTTIQFADFSDTNRRNHGSNFSFVGRSNDKVFYVDGNEVGRHIYRQDGSWITDGKIPTGTYVCERNSKKIVETVISAFGGLFRSFYPTGEIQWVSEFGSDGRLHGDNKMLSKEGKPLIHMKYKDGHLDGEFIEFNEDGSVKKRQVFVKGKPANTNERTPEKLEANKPE